MRNLKNITAAFAVLVVATLAMTGCVTTETSMHASRAKLYTDITEVIGESSAVVEIEVQSQEIVEDGTHTLSTATVISAFQPKGLAATLSSATPVAAADKVIVRQLGSSEQYGVPAPLLEIGNRYLLFLTPTTLEGDAGSQFYIVGGTAGLYTSESGNYVHVKTEDGDNLPATLTATELIG